MFGVDDLILGGLSFGGSLLSGFGARSSAKKQQKLQAAYEYVNKVRQEEQNAANERNFMFAQATNREAFDRMVAGNKALGQRMIDASSGSALVADAGIAGFNPVTWLSGMGSRYASQALAGWQLQQEQMFEEQAYQGQQYMMQAPTTQVPSVIQAIGGAVSAGASSLQQSLMNNKRVESANQSAMLQYLASVQRARQGGNAMSGLGTPAFNTTRSPVTLGGGTLRADKVNAWGIETKNPTAETPSIMGPGDQSVSGASTAQNAYDWPLSIPFGLYKGWADTYRQWTGRQWAGDFRADLSEVWRPQGRTERTQEHQRQADENAFGDRPWWMRNVPWLRETPRDLKDMGNPYVFGP